MDKYKEVKEFDIITCNEEYKEDDKYVYINKSVFKELTKFIYEFNSNQEHSDILDFMKIQYRRNVGNVISIKNYVGLIELKSGFKLQILPKISLASEDEGNVKNKKIFIEMIKSMKDFPSKIFTFANLNVEKMNLYEIFINMYIQEVKQLIKKGIKSSYVEKEQNISYFKGKLQVNQHIKYNLCHEEKFFMKFDEYQINNPENRIIKSTLMKLQKMSRNAKNVKEIKQLLTVFELVDLSNNYKQDFMKVTINRNTKDYDILIKWSEVFLLNKSFTTFSGNNSARALLFPMEKLFEAYVAKYVKKVYRDYEVSCQDKGYYLFNYPQNKFAIRPDIVIKRKDGSIIIMDTKWKRLYNNETKNYGISQADMYQMYAYAKKYKTSEVYLIYPMNEEMEANKKIKYISYSDDNEEICVNIFFIDLDKDKIEEGIEKLL